MFVINIYRIGLFDFFHGQYQRHINNDDVDDYITTSDMTYIKKMSDDNTNIKIILFVTSVQHHFHYQYDHHHHYQLC